MNVEEPMNTALGHEASHAVVSLVSGKMVRYCGVLHSLKIPPISCSKYETCSDTAFSLPTLWTEVCTQVALGSFYRQGDSNYTRICPTILSIKTPETWYPQMLRP